MPLILRNSYQPPAPIPEERETMLAILTTVGHAVAATIGGSRRWRKELNLLWVLPAFLLYFVFKLAPMIGGVYLSLLDWDGIEPPEFVGLRNYARMFSDEIIGLALLHNVWYALGTVAGKIVISLFLALLLN